MLTTPDRSADEIEANACFDALLWALSRPGQIKELPQKGEASIIAALIDRECRVYAGDPRLIPQIMQTGAQIAEPADADHLFLADLPALGFLQDIRMGCDLYPDEGATLIVRAKLGIGQRLRLTGPGVNGTTEIALSGLPDGFWQQRAKMIRYPMGFDMLVLDGAQIIGLPRSTKIEVL